MSAKKEKKEFKYIPEDLKKIIIKPSNEWKHASTILREIQALRVGASFFDLYVDKTIANTDEFEKFMKEVTKNLLTSPAYVFPEKCSLLKNIKRDDYLKP